MKGQVYAEREDLTWVEDEEKSFVFQREGCPKFSFAQNVEKKPSELNLYAAKKKE